MPLFLVTANVVETQYMGNERTFTDARIVEEVGEAEAMDLYEKYWTTQTDEYSIYYRVSGVQLTGVLTKVVVAEMIKKKEDRKRPLTRR